MVECSNDTVVTASFQHLEQLLNVMKTSLRVPQPSMWQVQVLNMNVSRSCWSNHSNNKKQKFTFTRNSALPCENISSLIAISCKEIRHHLRTQFSASCQWGYSTFAQILESTLLIPDFHAYEQHWDNTQSLSVNWATFHQQSGINGRVEWPRKKLESKKHNFSVVHIVAINKTSIIFLTWECITIGHADFVAIFEICTTRLDWFYCFKAVKVDVRLLSQLKSSTINTHFCQPV